MKDYYTILKVGRGATRAEIKSAYRQIALVLHPDVNQGCKDKSERFKDASEAYRVLEDTKRRREYDRSIGIRRVDLSYATHAANAGGHPLHTARPPPGMDVKDTSAWRAWHYGDNAVWEESIKQNNTWMDLGHNHPAQQFYRRQNERERAAQGPGRGHRGGGVRAEKHAVRERARLRRELRMERGAAATSAVAGNGGSGCAVM